MRLLRLIAPILLGLAAAASAAPAPVYFVMRHLQKAEGADPPLSAEGRRNADRLARWFGRDRPAIVYVSTTRRAHETAAPLVARYHLTVRDYDPRDTPGLVARVRQEKANVLIVGHSNTVPDIVAALGGTRPPPLAESDFGGIWRVGRDGRTEKKALGK